MEEEDDDSFNDAPDGDSDDSFNDAPDMEEAEDSDNSFNDEIKDYEVMDWKQVGVATHSLVEDVADTLDVSELKASLLLRTNSWNKEKLVAAYFEDSKGVAAKAGVELLGKTIAAPPSGDIECRICDDDVPVTESKALGCGHWFCKDCWGDYLSDRINKGKESVLSKCPSHQCSCVVDDHTVQSLVSEEEYTRYATAVLRSFVEDSQSFRWCPAPRCDKVVKGRGGTLTVKCDCSFKFCFKCNEEDHSLVTCSNLQVWLDKCNNESETAHWIIANTKKCPKCSIRIEKNQGCNHMACRTCNFEFCWICMGDWKEHGNHTGGYYKCNKYDPKNKKNNKKGSKEEAKAELDRYLHYYQRYHSHDQSKNFADKQRKATEGRMTDLQESSATGSTWMDVQFLKNALEQVFDCRQVLKYTYVFGYYLDDGPEKELFEYLQQELEKTTEKLSELSEMSVDKIDRTEVVNYTRVTKSFMKNLLDGVHNGLTSSVT